MSSAEVVVRHPNKGAQLDHVHGITGTSPIKVKKVTTDYNSVYRTMNTILFTKLEKFEQFADELSEPHPDLLPTVRSVLMQRFDPKFYADEVAVIDEQLEKLDSALETEAVALRATREREEVELRKLRELEESCRPQIDFVTTSETAREVMRAKTDALMSGIVGADKV